MGWLVVINYVPHNIKGHKGMGPRIPFKVLTRDLLAYMMVCRGTLSV